MIPFVLLPYRPGRTPNRLPVHDITPWRGVVMSSPRHLHNLLQPERPCAWTWRRLHQLTRPEWQRNCSKDFSPSPKETP